MALAYDAFGQILLGSFNGIEQLDQQILGISTWNCKVLPWGRAQQDLLGAVRFLQGDKDGHQLPGQSWLLLIGDCAAAWDALSDTSLE